MSVGLYVFGEISTLCFWQKGQVRVPKQGTLMDKEGGLFGAVENSLRLAGNPFLFSFHEHWRLSLAFPGVSGHASSRLLLRLTVHDADYPGLPCCCQYLGQ